MIRKSIDDLGHLQRDVMEVIWKMGEATVYQVLDRLDRKRKPAYTTVLSVMQKLEKSGWLKHRSGGRTYIYEPARTREEVSAGSLRNVLDLAFRGDPLLMFQSFINEQDLSEEELLELKQMIDKKRKEGR
jgi:predicted transcriptional regulator